MSKEMKVSPVTDKNVLLEQYRADHEAACADYTKAVSDNDAKKMAELDEVIKENESAYAQLMQTKVFDELVGSDNIIKAAVEKYSYPIIRHKRISDEGVLVGYETDYTQEKQIDLVYMCQYLHLPSDWKYKVERFNQLLTLRAATELKMSKSDIREICDSYYMSEKAKDIDLGGTPTSNTQMCKALQGVFDAILFEDNGDGKNKYKVNSHDVAYLLMTYTRKGKKALSVKVSRHADFHKSIMDVMYRVVCNKQYTVDYKFKDAKEKGVPVEVPSATESESEPEEK